MIDLQMVPSVYHKTIQKTLKSFDGQEVTSILTNHKLCNLFINTNLKIPIYDIGMGRFW